MAVVVAIAVGHVFMVFAVDPYALRSMMTGGYDESLSPESRNARPFYHLLPKWRGAGDRARRAAARGPAAHDPAGEAP